MPLSFNAVRSALPAILLLISALLNGCVTDQSTPVASVASAHGPIPRGQAGITITRLDGLYGSFVAANVSANGAPVASLEKGGTYSGSLPSGPVTLTVSSAGDFTHYSLHFNAQAGKRYAFEISPRNEQYAAMVFGGLVGYAADAAVNGEQAGQFKIVEVSGDR
jgi:hypothetical protein